MATRPVRIPSAPSEYSRDWAETLVRQVNNMYNDIASFRSATGQYAITCTAVNRTLSATISATEVREVLITMAKDLQEKGGLP